VEEEEDRGVFGTIAGENNDDWGTSNGIKVPGVLFESGPRLVGITIGHVGASEGKEEERIKEEEVECLGEPAGEIDPGETEVGEVAVEDVEEDKDDETDVLDSPSMEVNELLLDRLFTIVVDAGASVGIDILA
jgi:hypothetical protein